MPAFIPGLPPDFLPGWPGFGEDNGGGGGGGGGGDTEYAAFPSGLPCGLQTGYGLQHVSPLIRTPMVSGRARQRRAFTSTPTIASVQWLFTRPQAQAFEAWFRSTIHDGADWFTVRLSTPLGSHDYLARFAGMYDGPRLAGGRYWEIAAEVELEERAVLPWPWGEYGIDLILNQEIIDRALNAEWPAA